MLGLWEEATDSLRSATNVNFFIGRSSRSSKLLRGDIPRASATVLSPFPLQVSREGGGEEKGTGVCVRAFP